MITLLKQANGAYAVSPDGRFLGIVGHDENGWWANHGARGESERGFMASFLYVSGLRTRRSAIDQLINWHGIAGRFGWS